MGEWVDVLRVMKCDEVVDENVGHGSDVLMN